MNERFVLRSTTLYVALALALAQCVTPRARSEGSECVFNGDCASPLICAGGRCRTPCRTTQDCLATFTCEAVPSTRPLDASTTAPSVMACLPPGSAQLCGAMVSCPEGLRCNREGACVPECVTRSDCRSKGDAFECTSGRCVDPSADAGADGATFDAGADGATFDAGADGAIFDAPIVNGDGASDAVGDGATRMDGADAEDVTSDGAITGPVIVRALFSGPEASSVCARDASGRHWCWGAFQPGRLSYTGAAVMLMTGDEVELPTIVAGLPSTARIAIGDGHTCVIDGAGAVSCQGAGASGELGDGVMHPTPRGSLAPVRPSVGAVDDVQLGRTSFALRRDGTVAYWPTSLSTPEPSTVSGLAGIRAISSNGATLCAITASGTVRCMGDNRSGQCARPEAELSVDAPGFEVRVTGGALLSGVTAIAVGATQPSIGDATACALATSGVYCWGNNTQQQAGVARATMTGFEYVREATRVLGVSDVVSLAVSQRASCARTLRSGLAQVFCWGAATESGTRMADSHTPREILGVRSIDALVSHGGGFCGLRADGAVWCWGTHHGTGLVSGSIDRPLRVEFGP